VNIQAGALLGRVALVTGGARGIGYATAEELALCGASVALFDLDRPAVEEAAAKLAADYGVETSAMSGDVSDDDGVREAFATLDSRFGRGDVLVNNAGIMTPAFLPVPEAPVADFDRMLSVHLRGAYLCCQHAVPLMKRHGYGRVINLSSVLGVLGLPNRSAYAVAKTGIIGLTRSLAVEGGRYGITANTVAPGWVLTQTLQQRVTEGKLDYERYAQRTPLGRWGLPREVGRLIAFLALPSSGFITGALIPIDGGYTMRGDAGEAIGPLGAELSSLGSLFQ